MLVTPLVLIQIFSKRMLVDWPKCGSDPQDEGHLACLRSQTPLHAGVWPILLLVGIYLAFINIFIHHKLGGGGLSSNHRK